MQILKLLGDGAIETLRFLQAELLYRLLVRTNRKGAVHPGIKEAGYPCFTCSALLLLVFGLLLLNNLQTKIFNRLLQNGNSLGR